MKATSSTNVCEVSSGFTMHKGRDIGIALVGLLRWQLPAVKHEGLLP